MTPALAVERVGRKHPLTCDWHLDQSMYDCTCGIYTPCPTCWFGQSLDSTGDWQTCPECKGTGTAVAK